MITQIPTESEFFSSGTDFLNLGWEAAIKLRIDMKEAEGEAEDEEAEDDLGHAEYSQKSQRILATSIALAHRAQNFY